MNAVTVERASDGWWIAERTDRYGTRYLGCSKASRSLALKRLGEAILRSVAHRRAA